MKRHLRIISMVVAGLILSAGIPHAAESIAAKVGGVPITHFELNQKLQQILPFKGGFHGNVRAERVEELRGEALQEMIDKAYLVQYGIQEEVAVDFTTVEEEYQKIRKRFKSDQDLTQALGGESPATLRAAIYRKLLAEKVETVFLDDKAAVSDQEARQHYEQNKKMYLRPERFRASVIYIRVDPSAPPGEGEKMKKKAEDLVAKAKAGEDFYNLAYYNSDHDNRYVGGDMGSFHRGQMKDKDLEKVIISLQPGEIAGPIHNIYGYHILKLTEKEAAKQLSFDEAKSDIKSSLERVKREHLSRKLMDELKAKYPVIILDQSLAEAAKK